MTRSLMVSARRLAPFVAAGLISFSEALDQLMGDAVLRCNWTPGHLYDVEKWLGRRLAEMAAADTIDNRRMRALADAARIAHRRSFPPLDEPLIFAGD